MKLLSKALLFVYVLVLLGTIPAFGKDSSEPTLSKSSDPKVIADINEIESNAVKIGILLASIVVIGSVVVIGRKTWIDESPQA